MKSCRQLRKKIGLRGQRVLKGRKLATVERRHVERPPAGWKFPCEKKGLIIWSWAGYNREKHYKGEWSGLLDGSRKMVKTSKRGRGVVG